MAKYTCENCGFGFDYEPSSGSIICNECEDVIIDG